MEFSGALIPDLLSSFSSLSLSGQPPAAAMEEDEEVAEGLEEEVVDRVVEAAFAAVPQQVVQQVQADRQLAEQLQREEEAGGHVSPPAVGAADGSVSSSAVLGMGISLPHHLSLIPVVWWSVVPVPQKFVPFFSLGFGLFFSWYLHLDISGWGKFFPCLICCGEAAVLSFLQWPPQLVLLLLLGRVLMDSSNPRRPLLGVAAGPLPLAAGASGTQSLVSSLVPNCLLGVVVW